MIKAIPETYKHWSNSCGDLFTPLPELKAIDENELPDELRWLFNNLWTEELGFRCYLTELDGKFGISLEDEYSRHTANIYDISYEEYLEHAERFAYQIREKFPQVQVMFSKNYQEWNDGSKDSIIAVFMSYDIIQLQGRELFYKVSAFMDKEHPIHEMYEKRRS